MANVIHRSDDLINKCFRTFCRDIASSDAGVALMHLKDGEDVTVTLIVEPEHEFGLASANLIKMEDWDVSYLQQVSSILHLLGTITKP